MVSLDHSGDLVRSSDSGGTSQTYPNLIGFELAERLRQTDRSFLFLRNLDYVNRLSFGCGGMNQKRNSSIRLRIHELLNFVVFEVRGHSNHQVLSLIFLRNADHNKCVSSLK